MTHFGYSIQRSTDIEDTLWIARNALRNNDASAALLPDFIDMLAAATNDDGRVLGDDEASHVDHCRRSWGSRGCC